MVRVVEVAVLVEDEPYAGGGGGAVGQQGVETLGGREGGCCQ